MAKSVKHKKVIILFKYLNKLMDSDIEKAIKILTIADISHLLKWGRFIIPGNYIIKDNKLVKDIIQMKDYFVYDPTSEVNLDWLSKSDIEELDSALTKDYDEIEEKALDRFKEKDEYNELDVINAFLEGKEKEGMYQYVKEHLDIQKILDNI